MTARGSACLIGAAVSSALLLLPLRWLATLLTQAAHSPFPAPCTCSNLRQLLRSVTIGGIPFTRTAYGEAAGACRNACAADAEHSMALLAQRHLQAPHICSMQPLKRCARPAIHLPAIHAGTWELNSPGRNIAIPQTGAEIVLTSVDGQRISKRLRSLGSQDLGTNFA